MVPPGYTALQKKASVAWLAVLCFPALAICQDVSVERVTVGLQGYYRVGHITQVRVDLTSSRAIDGVRMEMIVPDDEGVPAVNVTDGLRIVAGANPLTATLKFGRVNGSLRVRLMGPDDHLLVQYAIPKTELDDAVLGSQNLVLTLGPNVDADDSIAMRREKNGQETVHGRIQNARALPNHWLGYGGVSLLILPTGPASLLAEMSSEQLEALQQWIQMGGRLILSCGSRAAEVVGPGGPLAALAPGDFERVQMQRQTAGIENFAGKTQHSLTYYVAEGEIDFRMPMAAIQNIVGDVVVAEGIGTERTASIIRSSYGFGHVIFVALDLDHPPMSQWTDGRKRVLGKLLDMALGAAEREENDYQYSQLTQIGFDDISGQLRSALDQFNDVRLVPFSWIMMLVTVYVLLIGPLDYFVLRRWNQRFRFTWITFPLIVLAGCGLAHAMTQVWKGHSIRANQVEILDIDAQSQLSRTLAWSHVFSPTSRRFDFALQPAQQIVPASDVHGNVVSWHGLPGRSFGGMNTERVHDASTRYQIINQLQSHHRMMQVRGMPIAVYASRSLHGMIWGHIDLGGIAALQADANNQLSGTVANPLPVDLRDSLLCFGRGAYPLGTIPAGSIVKIDRFSNFKTIDGLLTRTQVDQDYKIQSQPWDRKSFDVNRIVQLMMFHKAAGGTKYTSLLHRYQGEVDFSDHLTEGKALLIGRTKEPATTLKDVDQLDRDRTTFVRILLPVSPYRTNETPRN